MKIKIKDQARVRSTVHTNYSYVRKFEKSNIFSYLILMITLPWNYVFVSVSLEHIEFETFLRTLIYTSMCMLSFMILCLTA